MDTDGIIRALQGSRFFRNLSIEDLQKVASLCEVVTYDTGQFVFKQGDVGEHLYVILDGQIHLERSMNLGVRKGRVVLDTMGRGRTLGCWSAVLGESHVLMSSASCQKPSTLLALAGHDLRAMMIGNPGFGFNIMERLCFLLRDRIQAAYGAMDRI